MVEDRTVSWDQLTQSILSNLYYLMVNASQSQVMFLTPLAVFWVFRPLDQRLSSFVNFDISLLKIKISAPMRG